MCYSVLLETAYCLLYPPYPSRNHLPHGAYEPPGGVRWRTTRREPGKPRTLNEATLGIPFSRCSAITLQRCIITQNPRGRPTSRLPPRLPHVLCPPNVINQVLFKSLIHRRQVVILAIEVHYSSLAVADCNARGVFPTTDSNGLVRRRTRTGQIFRPGDR